MELQEFVTETLLALVRGVSDARKQHQGIAPRLRSSEAIPTHSGTAGAHMVQFDVAITVASKDASGIKAGITVVNFISGSAGTKLEAANENSTVSRVRFSVPITFDVKSGD